MGIKDTWFYRFILTEDEQKILIEDYEMAIENRCPYGPDCVSCLLLVKLVNSIIELESFYNKSCMLLLSIDIKRNGKVEIGD